MFPFTVRQIEAFLIAASSDGFGQAATALRISQPAVSRLLKSLEQQLGFELFERRPGRTPRLSAAGRAFREQASAFLQSGQLLGANRRPWSSRQRRPIRSYVGGHLMNEFLRPVLPRFYAKHPHTVFDFIPDRPRARVVEEIRLGLIDFALFATMDQQEFGAELIGTDSAGLYGTCAYLFLRDHVASASEHPFVLPNAGTIDEAFVLGALASRGIMPNNVVARSQFYDLRLTIAAQGKAVAYSSDSVASRFPQRDLLKLADMPPWFRWLFIGSNVAEDIRLSLRELIMLVVPRTDCSAGAGLRDAVATTR